MESHFTVTSSCDCEIKGKFLYGEKESGFVTLWPTVTLIHTNQSAKFRLILSRISASPWEPGEGDCPSQSMGKLSIFSA